MAKDKRTRDQKRIAKLAERARKQAAPAVTPYEGRTYQAPQWVPYVFATESAIHEAQVMCEPRLTNEHVRHAVTELVFRLRRGLPPTLAPDAEMHYREGEEAEFVLENIHRNWGLAFDKHGRVATNDLIGILRTILFSVEAQAWHRGPAAGYLAFLKDWMKKMGVRLERRRASDLGLTSPDEPPAQLPPPEPPLP